jgi:hypothetical protein
MSVVNKALLGNNSDGGFVPCSITVFPIEYD